MRTGSTALTSPLIAIAIGVLTRREVGLLRCQIHVSRGETSAPGDRWH